MLQITDNAVRKVQALLAAENKQGYGLRVAVQGGGCSGFEYGMSWEQDAGANDRVMEFGELKVFVDAMSAMYLDDVSIDYVEGLEGAGWRFQNPKATGTCGCGSSFSM